MSLATASRALNPKSVHPVRAETRSRVLAAAGELGYSASAVARAMRTQRLQAVMVIVHDIRDPYFAECARGVTDVADEASFLTFICNSLRDPQTELRYVQSAEDYRASGVIFVGGGFEGRGYRAAMSRRVAALRGYGAHAIALGPRRDRIPAEVADNRGGGRQGTEYLIALGHERIAFIDGPDFLRTSHERRAGYRDALENAGIEYDESLVVDGRYNQVGGAQALRQLLGADVDFTAVFSSSDAMAFGCIAELRARGLGVPQDVSLIGFGDVEVVRWFDPPLTCVSVPTEELGAAAMRRLLSLLDDGDAATRRRLVNVHPTKLVIRGSAGPPRRSRKHPSRSPDRGVKTPS